MTALIGLRSLDIKAMPATNGHHLAELGFDVIHEDVDYPPLSELPRVLARLRELGKPFVVIMPCSTLTTRSVSYTHLTLPTILLV